MEDKPKEIKKTKKESEKKETQNLDQNKQKDQSVSNFEIENSVLLYPVSTEKAINSIESQNQIVFAVKLKATKKQIKEEFEKLFNVKVKKINTKISMKGVKHAYIKLKEGKADEIAMQLKMI